MIVTICGAYKNVGDHLIGSSARVLLRKYVDNDIVVVDRRQITDETYEIFAKATAVYLTGGPAYQGNVYPTVYPIRKYETMGTPIIPFGIGLRASFNEDLDEFKFQPKAQKFLEDVHQNYRSSARDVLTKRILAQNCIDNVEMTGCPAWYDLYKINSSYQHRENAKTIVLSVPAVMHPELRSLIKYINQRFPKARKILSYHHGLLPADTPLGREIRKDFIKLAAFGTLRGWRFTSLAEDENKMRDLYLNADLHIGYRVHAHLFCLSQRIPSILISEDYRGVGQNLSLGMEDLRADPGGDISKIAEEIEFHFDTKGERVSGAIEKIDATFPAMESFLSSL